MEQLSIPDRCKKEKGIYLTLMTDISASYNITISTRSRKPMLKNKFKILITKEHGEAICCKQS